MLPRWHIFYGALFTLIIWYVAPSTHYFYLALVFLSSFLIDFDHYVTAVQGNKSISLFKAFDYYKKMMKIEENEQKRGIYRKGDFHLFHTIEFHLLIAALGLLWTPFFYIFIGMTFHSLIDVYSLLTMRRMYRREYFFFNWVRKKF